MNRSKTSIGKEDVICNVVVTIQKKYMRIDQCAIYLGVAEQTIRNWVCAKKMPYYKLNTKIVLFCIEEIDEWLKSGSVKAI
jgi:excisionase family DNA binding protein